MERITTKLRGYLLPLLFLTVSLSVAQPVMLTDSLSTTAGEFALLRDGRVIFINADGIMRSVNTEDPFNTEAFAPDWELEDDGWQGPGVIRFMKGSPDGNLLCLAVSVLMPDSLRAQNPSMPEPVIILVCSSEGEEAVVAGISVDSLWEPSLDFSQDSRLFYGAGFLPRNPDPESFFAHCLGDESSAQERFEVVDIVEGVRLNSRGIIGESFVANPWSDLIISDGRIADMATLSEVVTDSSVVLHQVEQWVEPDAWLADADSIQVICYVDGAVNENTGAPFVILCRLSDGSYVFTRGEGTELYRGTVNWQTFEAEEPEELSDLAGYLSPGHRIAVSRENLGIVFSAGRGLYYYEFQ